VIARAGLESAPGQHRSVAAATGFTVRNALTAPGFRRGDRQAVGAVQVLNKPATAVERSGERLVSATSRT
jgi:hypothetical protein